MKTIYKLSIVALMLVMGFGASAQHVLPVRFTLEGGLNISNSSWDASYLDKKARLGFQIGMMVEYPVTDAFYVQSGLSYTRKGAKVEGYRKEANGGDLNREITMNQMYLQIPLYAAYKIEVVPGTKIVFNAGPYIAQGIAGTSKVPGKITFWNDNYLATGEFSTFGGHDSLKRFDFGLGGGAGVEFASVVVTLRYELGLTDIGKEELSYKNRNAAITLGYKF
ncbi:MULTISPECIES: porin family protein [unclassified Dysgonomonas]|uniref:porin family protein n=1 Tax=unclassified Dysgonomonas TaxID=2630389 RepID=UPI0006834E48|nr:MULTISPECIES: porin family protein [unclassified Dysgonomonas]MBD8346368.1 PorT family protein [Dysgonomonas sp. HGC4]MBF0574715.1 PorT family protein [Dysgonomonas sp. GY617]